MAAFTEYGLPTRKDEDWKYSNLAVAKLRNSAFQLDGAAATPEGISDLEGTK